MKDIESRKDIESIIDKFYQQVIGDDVIGLFFTEVMELNWNVHIPIMYDFWETTLLGSMTYKGNPMLKHLSINEKKPLEPKHFNRWLELWENTIRDNFVGAKANEAIERANQIAALMRFKVTQASKHHKGSKGTF